MTKELTLNKFAAGLVGLAMVAGLASAVAVQRAQAAELTLSDLVEFLVLSGVIADDKAAEARAAVKTLEAEKGTTPAAPAATSCNFTRDLKTGASGADVKELQKLLNGKGYTVAATGAGSAGMETEYYGPATAAAVAKMQEAFAADILAPLGLTKGTGFFGAATRKVVNEKVCATTPTTPVLPPEEEEEESEEEEENEETELSGEASLKTVEINDADDSDIEENEEEAEIAEIDVEFSDGDAMITRLDIALVHEDAGKPWDAFETVALMVDGEEVASIEADDEDNYLDEDDGSLRFTGLDIVAMEDEEITITVAATVLGGLDAAELGNWDVQALSMRFVDGDDVTTTDTETGDLDDGADVATFTIEEEGGEDELIVKTSTKDPSASTIKVEDDKKSDFETIFAFDLDTDDSTNDIEVNEITVGVVATEDGTTATSVDLLINDAVLVIDGEEYDDVTITNGQFVFDIDGDLVIEAGERVTAEFQAEFKALASTLEGATVQASTTGSTLEAEGADDLAADQLSGSATGDEHTLRTAGAAIEWVSSTGTKDANSGDEVTDDEGVWVIKFDVEAFDSDIYIAKSAASSTGTGQGVSFRFTDGSGNVIAAAGTTSASLASTAGSETGTDDVSRFVVNEGETKTFTLTVELDPTTGGFHGVQLYSVNYKTANTAAATVEQTRALPAEDFETDPLSI